MRTSKYYAHISTITPKSCFSWVDGRNWCFWGNLACSWESWDSTNLITFNVAYMDSSSLLVCDRNNNWTQVQLNLTSLDLIFLLLFRDWKPLGWQVLLYSVGEFSIRKCVWINNSKKYFPKQWEGGICSKRVIRVLSLKHFKRTVFRWTWIKTLKLTLKNPSSG